MLAYQQGKFYEFKPALIAVRQFSHDVARCAAAHGTGVTWYFVGAQQRGTLTRTLTDGDLRRAILKGAADTALLGALPIARPTITNEEANAADVLHIMGERQIDDLPVLDVAAKLVDVIFRRELSRGI